MIDIQWRREWKAFVAIAVVLGLLLLLLPDSPAFHDGLTAWFVLLPVFLFGITESPGVAMPARETHLAFYRAPALSALFQRPPPPALA